MQTVSIPATVSNTTVSNMGDFSSSTPETSSSARHGDGRKGVCRIKSAIVAQIQCSAMRATAKSVGEVF